MSGNVRNEQLQKSVRSRQVKLIVGAVFWTEIKRRRTDGTAAIAIRAHILQRQVLAFPMHMAGDASQIEFGPVERAAVDFKVQIRIRFVVEGNDAPNPSGRGLTKLVGFDGPGDLWTDGARNYLRLGRAEAISQ